MKKVKAEKVVKLHRKPDGFYVVGSEKSKLNSYGYVARGSMAEFCPSIFESVTGIKMEKGESCLVRIKIQKVKP